MKTNAHLKLTLRGGGRTDLCSSILQPCKERAVTFRLSEITHVSAVVFLHVCKRSKPPLIRLFYVFKGAKIAQSTRTEKLAQEATH